MSRGVTLYEIATEYLETLPRNFPLESYLVVLLLKSQTGLVKSAIVSLSFLDCAMKRAYTKKGKPGFYWLDI